MFHRANALEKIRIFKSPIKQRNGQSLLHPVINNSQPSVKHQSAQNPSSPAITALDVNACRQHEPCIRKTPASKTMVEVKSDALLQRALVIVNPLTAIFNSLAAVGIRQAPECLIRTIVAL